MYACGFAVEVWLKSVLNNLKMLDRQLPELEQVVDVLTCYLPQKVARAKRHLNDPDDLEEWLDLVLKTDALVKLEDDAGRSLRIAVDVTVRETELADKLSCISSREFRLIRRRLSIAQHWILLVKPDALPSRDRLMDAFYEQVDKSQECAIITL